MTMTDITQLIEATFEFNRESKFYHAVAEFRKSPKDGGSIWVWIYDNDYENDAEYVFVDDRESMLRACKMMATVIAEEKSCMKSNSARQE